MRLLGRAASAADAYPRSGSTHCLAVAEQRVAVVPGVWAGSGILHRPSMLDEDSIHRNCAQGCPAGHSIFDGCQWSIGVLWG